MPERSLGPCPQCGAAHEWRKRTVAGTPVDGYACGSRAYEDSAMSHQSDVCVRAEAERLRDTVVWVLENVEELEGSWHSTVEQMSGVTL